MPPALHQEFIARAVPLLAADPRLVGVAAAGSYATGTMDEYSDLDLVIAVEPAGLAAVLAERAAIAASLGPLLAAFTGEHVGEPRLLICLYGPPLLHVDLKFVGLPDIAYHRVDDPVVLWQRDGALERAMLGSRGSWPAPDLQWIEDRFWVWVHYGAAKIGRGELLEAVDMLGFLRARVLGPLVLHAAGAPPMGVRRIETAAPHLAPALARTVAGPEAAALARALLASAGLYRELRERAASAELVRRGDAERESLAYLAAVARA